MAAGGGGSCTQCVLKMFEEWGNDRTQHLALYGTGTPGAWFWWRADSAQEASWLRGQGWACRVFRGGYWSFVQGISGIVGVEMEKELRDGIPKTV
jgi:hypothetical protein